MQGSIIQLGCVDAWLETVLAYFKHIEKRSRHIQKVYVYISTSNMRTVVSQLIDQACKLVQILEPEELELSFEITGKGVRRKRKTERSTSAKADYASCSGFFHESQYF